jgi:putative hemin transport protein
MIFVGNRGAIQIHTGPIKHVLDTKGWLNVLDHDFNLHLRLNDLHKVWLVRKPTKDGVVSSMEILDEQGDVIALIFGKRKPGQAELDTWRDLLESCRNTSDQEEAVMEELTN